MFKRIAAVIVSVMIALTFAAPAEAAPRVKDVVVTSDPSPTFFYITYDVTPKRTLIKCINVKTTYGRTRTVTVRAYNGNKYVGTPIKNLEMPRRELRICANRVMFVFPSTHQPNLRITVIEKIPGPLNPVGRRTVPLN